MIAKGIKLTELRRAVLAALTPGQGIAADELRRRVATARGLEPTSEGWPVFSVSYARALRLLEGKGVLELERGAVIFGKACPTWVRLTPDGERERVRALGRDIVNGLAAELDPDELAQALRDLERTLARASEPELARFEALVAGERSRRAGPRLFA